MKLTRLDPAAERRGRIFLWGGLGLVVAALVLTPLALRRPSDFEAEQSWIDVDFTTFPEVRLLQDYVRIDTSADTGSELEGARFLAARLAEMGLDAEIERLGDKRANLWAILEGTEREALVLHHHIDVSTIFKPEEWVEPPFSGVISPPWIYGRGVFDMKSVAVAQLLALADLAERAAGGERPRRSVIFLATGSEEVGSELGSRWILDRHPELTSRFATVLTEGGVIEATSRSHVKYWGIEFAQNRFVEAEACSASRERLELLREEMADWSGRVERPTLVPEIATFIASYAGTRTRPDFQDLVDDTWKALLDPSVFRGLSPFLRSLFRSEVLPFEVEESPEGGYRLRILFHLLPGEDFDQVRRRLLPPWLTHGVALVVREPLGADGGSPVSHPDFIHLVEAVAASYPEAPVGPYFLPWSATDSRFFRQAGVRSYGFSPFPLVSSDTFRVDAANERIDLPGFIQGIELYRDAVDRLTR